jgi:hypothetical protein
MMILSKLIKCSRYIGGLGTDIIAGYEDTDSILLQGGITEIDLEFVNTPENLFGGVATDDLLIILRSTGKTLAVISDTTVEEFNQIKIIEPLII